VSPGIVSRVLDASRADIGEDLRRTILDSAQALGCVPSAKTHRLGVLFMDESAKGLTHPFFAAVLDAFKVAAESKGYDVTFINHRIGDNVMTYLEYCQYRRLDGVCIACIDFEDPQVVELVKSGIACVTVDHIYKRSRPSCRITRPAYRSWWSMRFPSGTNGSPLSMDTTTRSSPIPAFSSSARPWNSTGFPFPKTMSAQACTAIFR
jgi:hypothetical protein